jgi:hypothetical protein
MLRNPPLTLPLLLVACFACQPATFEDEGSSNETGDGDGEVGDGDGEATGDGDSGDGDPTFNCDPTADMPCPDGQKCTVLITSGPPTYDCVPDDAEKLTYETCTPAPGTGQDGCPSGHSCIPSALDDSIGLCMPLCTSDSDCDAALCTTPPQSQIPVCGAICDPLAPLCPELQVCQRVRKSNFVCQFPLETDVGTTAEQCNNAIDSGCAEGFVCETGGVVSGCTESSCCTALCDLSDTDPCMAPMICGELPLDPQPGLENVGACYIPQ